MRQLTRLLRYVLPFGLQLLPGVLLLAAVGFLEAFRLVLVKPIFDRVLNPSTGSDNIQLFTITCSSSFPHIFIMPGRLWRTRWLRPRSSKVFSTMRELTW